MTAAYLTLAYLAVAIICMVVVTDPDVHRVRFGLLWPIVFVAAVVGWAISPVQFGQPLAPLFVAWLSRRQGKFYGFTTKRFMVGVIRIKQ